MSLISRPFGPPSDAWKSNSPLDVWRSPSDAWGVTPFSGLGDPSALALLNPYLQLSMLPTMQASSSRPLRQLGISGLLTCDIVESPTEYRVAAELPGVPQSCVNVHVDGNTLTIRAERQNDFEADNFTYHRRECQSGRVERTFEIPTDGIVDKTNASFIDGRLIITVPRTIVPGSITRKSIPITQS